MVHCYNSIIYKEYKCINIDIYTNYSTNRFLLNVNKYLLNVVI